MQSRLGLFLLAGALVAGCAPGADEEADAVPATATTESATAADEAALEQIRADYVTHYNMQHADVVAGMYTDSAFALWSDGAVTMGRPAVQTYLQENVATSPTLNLTTGGTMVLGENAVAHGTWDVSATPEGATEPVAMKGHYLTYFTKVNGEWKIGGVITNFDAAPPEGFEFAETGQEEPPEEGTMGELVNAYVQAFNAGDAAAVANLYTEDGFHAYANLPAAEGRAAIQTVLAERFAAGAPTIEIHDVGTMDLGNGWALDGGWYTFTAPAEGGATETQQGTYMNLVQQQPDGSWKIHWGVSNGRVET